MITYIIRRCLYGFIIMLVTSALMFAIIISNPVGGPLNQAWSFAQTSIPGFQYWKPEQRKAKLDQINHRLGLDQPPYILYLRWLYNWDPDSQHNPTYLQGLLEQVEDDNKQAYSSQEEAHYYRDLHRDLPAQILKAQQDLATCQETFNFDSLKTCLAIPRAGGILSGNWGAGVGEQIFGQAEHQHFNSETKQMETVPDNRWHSPLLNTLLLITFGLLIALIFALLIGIYSAVKPYTPGDYILSLFSFAGMAMPVFWLAAILLVININLTQVGLPSIPVVGIVDDPKNTAQYGDMGMRLKHLLVPGGVLALGYVASLSRFLRSALLDVLSTEYIRTAWAKGLKPRTVILKHALRNALIPFTTRIALAIPLMLGSAVLVEHIFKYDGIGELIYKATFGDNWNLMMGLLVISSFLVVISSICADVGYAIIDPRIRTSYARGR